MTTQKVRDAANKLYSYAEDYKEEHGLTDGEIIEALIEASKGF